VERSRRAGLGAESLSQKWRQLQQGGPILHAAKLSMTFVQFLQLCQDRGLVGPDGLNPADLEQVCVSERGARLPSLFPTVVYCKGGAGW
jgi:hypothetical protein